MAPILSFFLRFAAIIVCHLGVLIAPALGQDEPESPSQYLLRLSDDSFAVRQAATYGLIDLGSTAVKAIENQVNQLEPESQSRAIGILKVLAVSKNPQTEADARDSLRRLASHRNRIVADAAVAANRLVVMIEQSQLVERLRQLGAGGSPKPVFLDGREFLVHRELQIHDNWTGTPNDLLSLGKLSSLESITINHSDANDQVMEQIGKLENLQRLSIKRSSITNQGIAHLEDLPNLESLEVFYSRINSGCVDSLQRMHALTFLRLIGTDISPDDDFISQLEQDLAADVDIRRGAFMGIFYRKGSNECRLTQVASGSGAEKAGLKKNDVIIKFNGLPVAEPQSLTKLLRQQAVGSKATLTVIRAGKTEEHEIEFGEWE